MDNYSFSTCSKLVLAVLLATCCWMADAESVKNYRRSMCGTRPCMVYGSEFHISRNDKINVCDDFYNHACDGWINKFYALSPSTSVARTTNSLIMESVRHEVHNLLRVIKPDDIEAVVKAKKLSASCNDLERIKYEGMGPVVQALINTGDWPLSVTPDTWNMMNLAWQIIHKTIADTQAVSALFDIDVEIDRHRSTAHILSFTVPETPSKRGRSDEDYRSYLHEAANLIKSLRSPNSIINPADFNTDIENLLIFQGKLEKLSRPRQQSDEPFGIEYRVVTIERLQREWDEVVKAACDTNTDYSVDWLAFISEKFINHRVSITESEIIALRPGNVVQELAKLLTETTERTIVNYIQWKMIDSLLPFTSYNSDFIQDTGRWDLDKDSPFRREYCVEKHPMSIAISYMYSKAYLNETSKAVALDMVDRIREELKLEISETWWMDDGTKVTTMEKLDAMKVIIGNPNWSSDIEKLNAYYEELTVGDDYFENMMAYRRFNMNKRYSRLYRDVTEEDIPFEFSRHRGSFTWYDYQTNALTIGAQNFQTPLYMDNRPTVLNYAIFGTIIAHEIAHSVDPIGRLYNQYGNKYGWWSDSTIANYKNKTKCFTQQFHTYTSDGKPIQETFKVKDEHTQMEYIADTVGVRLALKAFKKMWVENKTRESTAAPFNEYTIEQLFFYGYATSMCESINDEMLPIYYKNSKSVPHRLRVNGALSQIQEFSETFRCKSMAPMNPLTKCVLWR